MSGAEGPVRLIDLAQQVQEAAVRADYLLEAVDQAVDDALDALKAEGEERMRPFDRLIVLTKMAREQAARARDLGEKIECAAPR